jgi:hypothetical protein
MVSGHTEYYKYVLVRVCILTTDLHQNLGVEIKTSIVPCKIQLQMHSNATDRWKPFNSSTTYTTHGEYDVYVMITCH